MKGVFLYCHGPTEHTVFLVGSILQVHLIGLECESLASQIQFEAYNTPHYCQAPLRFDRVLSLRLNFLLAYPTGYKFPSFSCNSTVATPTPAASFCRNNGFIRSGILVNHTGYHTGYHIHLRLSNNILL